VVEDFEKSVTDSAEAICFTQLHPNLKTHQVIFDAL